MSVTLTLEKIKMKPNDNFMQQLLNTRNIGIIAHIDAGKTTTTERILYYTGKIYRMGEVHEGTATMDWMQQEQERGITIMAANTTCFWQDKKINIIDTPGHVDFTVEVVRSLKILDGAVVVFCAVGGVEPQSESVWHHADKFSVPRMAFINKMDRVGADFNGTINQIHERLTSSAAAIQMPIGHESSYSGIIDLVEMRVVFFKEVDEDTDIKLTFEEIPADLLEEASKQRHILIEKVSENDDILLDKYIHNKEITNDDLKKAIRRTVVSNKFVPILCGSSLKNKGIQLLLDAICDYLPSPIDVPMIIGKNPETDKQETRKARKDEKLCFLAFKIMSDPFVGKLVFVRVYSGTLKSGSEVYNVNRQKTERINKLVRMHANKQSIVEEAYAGDIVACVGLKITKTGDTLTDEAHPLLVEEINFPEPVAYLSIEPKTKADQDKLANALHKLQDEDPTFRVRYNLETGQTVISGMGELHLEIIVDRMFREFNVGANIGKPHVAYKETITKFMRCEGKFIQQTGGHGQYGHVIFEISPSKRGAGVEFENLIKGGTIPREYIPSVKKGVIEGAKNGVLAGFPVIDINVKLVDGSFHEVDSSDLAFTMAATYALSEGMRKASPVLLEPIMEIEITTPTEYLGDVIGDLNSRRVDIKHISEKRNLKIIQAFAPLSEMFGYASSLRSLTQGRAVYTMEPSHYSEVPKNIAEKVLS